MESRSLGIILFIGSALFTALMWLMHVPFFFLILFIPLIPFFSSHKRVKRCPVCGWETTGSENFCPYDATPLTRAGSEVGEGKHGNGDMDPK